MLLFFMNLFKLKNKVKILYSMKRREYNNWDTMKPSFPLNFDPINFS